STYMMSAQGLKRPFKLDFNRYVENQKLHGVSMVALGNHAADASFLRENLSYAIFRDAGVPAPRTAYVKLYLTVDGKHDRKYLGLYTMIEAVTKGFLRERFNTAEGMLLKPEKIQGLPYLGEDFKAYESRYQPKTKTDKKSERRLIEFTKLINNADDATFR